MTRGGELSRRPRPRLRNAGGKVGGKPVMTTRGKKSRSKTLVLLLGCVLFSGVLWAQTGEATGHAGSSASGAADRDSQSGAANSQRALHDDYVIGPEDVLAINVWKEPEISRSVTVRLDGAISLPLVGEVQAAGKTPMQLEREITKKLQAYISEPEVAVIVQEMRSKRFNVLGQVVKPGSYLLANSTTVLDAIAMAGGFRDFAKEKSIYVLRHNTDGTETRLPFNYKDVIKGKNTEQNIKLEPRDTVVVP
jgi:polysaccharide biosynthesis/export protein